MDHQDLDVNVKDLVQAVRRELEELDEARIAANRAPLFQLSGLELELHFAVVRERAGKGKLDLKVISVGGGLTRRAEEIQKVTVRFEVAPAAHRESVLGSRAHQQTASRSPHDVPPLDG